jgi:transcriptional regulator with XRE-family HTH domain
MRLADGKLRETRLRRALTQAELADKAGTTEATVNRLENGLRDPRMSTLRKIAAALGVEPADLIDWDAATEETRGKLAA